MTITKARRRSRETTVAEMATKNFAEHHLTCRLDRWLWRSWRCQKPGAWTYGFDVSTEPGRLIVAGDIGFCAWERERDMLSWLRGAIHDPHYMAGKVPQEIKVREFDEDVAKAWILQERREGNVTKEDARSLMDFDGEQGFFDNVYRHQTPCDYPPQCQSFTHGYLWQIEALRWFLKALDSEKP